MMLSLSQVAAPLSVLGQHIVATLCLTRTRKGSPLRLFGILNVALLGYSAFSFAPKFSTSGFYNGYFASQFLILSVHVFNLVWLSDIDARDITHEKSREDSKDGITKGSKDTSTKLSQDGVHNRSNSSFFRGFILVTNQRGVNTQWQTKNVPSFPKYYSKGSPPGRGQFLVRQLAFLAWHYLVLDFFDFNNALMPVEEQNRVFGPGTEFLYLDATVEQRQGRIASSIVSWLFVGRTMLDGFYRLYSIIMVGSGILAPEDFAPLFGSMWDAYTIRKFWGKFWHQTLRWPLTSLSNFICQKILYLPKPSLLERYTNIFLVFTLSGILHVVYNTVNNIEGYYVGNMMFFQSFVLGIMAEDAVQELWRRLTGTKKAGKTKKETPVWMKLLGAVWVMSFLCVVTPWYGYPNFRIPFSKRWVIPYPVTDKIGVRWAGRGITMGALILKFYFKGEL